MRLADFSHSLQPHQTSLSRQRTVMCVDQQFKFRAKCVATSLLSKLDASKSACYTNAIVYYALSVSAVFDSSLSSEVPDLEDSPVPMTSCNVTGLLEVESPILNLSSSLTNSNDTFDQLLDDLGEGQCRQMINSYILYTCGYRCIHINWPWVRIDGR